VIGSPLSLLGLGISGKKGVWSKKLFWENTSGAARPLNTRRKIKWLSQSP
jgi:hypothetical protein